MSARAVNPVARSVDLSRGRVRALRFVAARLQGFIVPVLALAIWEAAVAYGLVAAHLLPPPSVLLGTLVELHAGGELARHLAASTLRVLWGFTLGAGFAIVVGAAVGLSSRAEGLIGPTFQALRAIPSLAWAPLLLLWFGIGETPKVTLIAIGAFFPVYLNLVSAIHNVDRKLVEVGGVYGLKGPALVARIFLPASLPTLFVGLRSGLSLAWMFLVAAELIAASSGVGYLLTDGQETGRADIVIVAIVLLALLGKISDSILATVERLSLRWRDVYRSGT